MTRIDVAPRVGDDLDPQMVSFLQNKVNTFVKWDLIRFFHDNPHAADTAENIARFTGRDILAITDELAELVESNVLIGQMVSGRAIYRLADDRQMREIVNNFVRACDDRMFRVKAIYHVIRSMR
jgi:hypothetical protein